MTNRFHDVIGGAIGGAATIGVAQVNQWLACAIGVVTFSILLIRLRRAWRHRNIPPRSTELED